MSCFDMRVIYLSLLVAVYVVVTDSMLWHFCVHIFIVVLVPYANAESVQ